MPVWSTSQILSGGIFQVPIALSKIINNDTKDIISTPAMKLRTDPDAQNLKLISSSPRLRHLTHMACLPSPLGTQLTGAGISGKYWDSGILHEKF